MRERHTHTTATEKRLGVEETMTRRKGESKEKEGGGEGKERGGAGWGKKGKVAQPASLIAILVIR